MAEASKFNNMELKEKIIVVTGRGHHRDRLGWLILSSVFQTFVAVPVTLITARLNETQIFLCIPCVVAFLVTQIINFAGLSTKTIILAFYTGIAIDIGVIALSFIV